MKAILSIALFISTAVFFAACTTGTMSGGGGGADVAATVNGKPIKNEQVERILKAQLQGQESKSSQLEITQYRLQALQGIIQQEVMFQKAEAEKTLPTDEEVTQAFNEHKQRSGLSIDDYNKKMQEIGETEQTFRETIKRELAIKKLGDKVSASVEPPKDTEIEGFFKGNPDFFINKRGASFAAIFIDPTKSSENDPTKTPEEAALRLKELAPKLNTPGMDFAALASQYSEDPETAARGGEWQAFTVEQLNQFMGAERAAFVMDKLTVNQIVPFAVPYQGATVILKLTNKQMTDENLTLDSPNIKTRVIELLTNAKKQVLSAAYQARVISEARIENFLAKRVVDNPNEMSGARPADPNATPTSAESPAAANANTANANTPANASNANAPKANSNAPKTNANTTKK